MTKSQSESLNTAIKGWERVKGKITVLGEDSKDRIICELETSTFTQKFLIGKKGALKWLYKYNKL